MHPSAIPTPDNIQLFILFTFTPIPNFISEAGWKDFKWHSSRGLVHLKCTFTTQMCSLHGCFAGPVTPVSIIPEDQLRWTAKASSPAIAWPHGWMSGKHRYTIICQYGKPTNGYHTYMCCRISHEQEPCKGHQGQENGSLVSGTFLDKPLNLARRLLLLFCLDCLDWPVVTTACQQVE